LPALKVIAGFPTTKRPSRKTPKNVKKVGRREPGFAITTELGAVTEIILATVKIFTPVALGEVTPEIAMLMFGIIALFRLTIGKRVVTSLKMEQVVLLCSRQRPVPAG